MRRDEASPTLDEEQAGEQLIAALVPAFYAKVRQDNVIGPVFNQAIDHWDDHLETLVDFWSSVMLGSGRYKGQPMVAHARHQASIRPEMFDRWLSLWRETARERLPAAQAEAIILKAERIAESLKLGLFFRLDRR